MTHSFLLLVILLLVLVLLLIARIAPNARTYVDDIQAGTVRFSLSGFLIAILKK